VRILHNKVSFSMAEISQVLEEKKNMVNEKATAFRETRDEWNKKSKTHSTARNELNGEVKELIVQVREQRDIREQMNELVREKKQIRQDANVKVKDIKSKLDVSRGGAPEQDNQRGRRGQKPVTPHTLKRELQRLEREFEQGRHTGKNETKVMKRMKEISSLLKKMNSVDDKNDDMTSLRDDLRAALAEQEEAHEEVQNAANAAQEAHELMLQWNKEVDKQREKAESCHRELRKSKKEADKAHHLYIVSLRCLHSAQDLLSAMSGISNGKGKSGARVQVQDLMSKLMSGDTLSTEELMQLQKFD